MTLDIKNSQEIIWDLGVSVYNHNHDKIRDFTKRWVSVESEIEWLESLQGLGVSKIASIAITGYIEKLRGQNDRQNRRTTKRDR